MPGSQLKRLKASLKDQGIVGPQQSKKQRRRNAQDERQRGEKRLHRGVVLEGIREQFNPFDLKHAKTPKFEVTSNRPSIGANGVKGRPGQAKAASEERRRQTLLVDMQRRNKVGGIHDRRFGEDDPNLTLEDKMAERFAREKQRSHKKNSLFDLEEDEPMDGLTHGGRALSFDDDELVDDFNEKDLQDEDEADLSLRQRLLRKRDYDETAGESEEGGEAGAEEPERKKTKKEVMEEIIAKSKLHKFERQAAKEDDDALREELDGEFRNLQYLLATGRNMQKPSALDAPAEPATKGIDRAQLEKNFDLEVKRLALDKRAQPANRTKTDEERAEDLSKKLKELEDKRQRRMKGEPVSDSDDDDNDDKEDGNGKAPFGDDMSEDDGFGLGSGIKTRPTATELGFDDEDDFIIEDDLIASGSDLELLDSEDDENASGKDSGEEEQSEEEDEFTRGLLGTEDAKALLAASATGVAGKTQASDQQGLPFTFPCPSSSDEFRSITAPFPAQQLPTVVQRIRALYHPKLDSKNKERLGQFSVALVDFIASPWDPETSAPFGVLESLIRHIHSLAKMFPIEIASRFRHHIEMISQSRSLALQPCDMILLTAAGTIFPTSDHFHQVITPAMLVMARFLGQKVPERLSDYATGLYLSILVLQYQHLAKRYVPEVINFLLNTINSLSPTPSPVDSGRFPIHEPPADIRAKGHTKIQPRKPSVADCLPREVSGKQAAVLRVSLLSSALDACDAAADAWSGRSAFVEVFEQVVAVVHHLGDSKCRPHLPDTLSHKASKLSSKLERMLRLARISRKPLELHHHRPLAIKTFVPRFEAEFDPDKHYDPDRERAELAKLKAEHKKERKGAMRELRKDANFMAREKLRIKKAKDEAYEKKYKRLVAEIQSEEGKEANIYEREKDARKRAKNR